MLDNPNKFIIFLLSLFLFGCAAQGDPVKSTETKPVKVHCYPEAAKQFLRWNKSKGKVLNGLTKRRQEEMELFLRGCNNA